uniref:Syntaxin-8 n=1 Tax=Eptatretus burgeri TaxID=7764 RepID=A0A8C4R3W4_EPTBU
MEAESWLLQFEVARRLAQDIAEKLHEKQRGESDSSGAAKLTVSIRLSLQSLNRELAHLSDSLIQTSAFKSITQREAERRQNLLDELRTRSRQMEGTLEGNPGQMEFGRAGLFGGPGSGRVGTESTWGSEEPEEMRGLSFSQIRQQQQQIIHEQDEGLDALSAIIARQKHMGENIGDEIDTQNEIIDDLTHLVDKTNSKIHQETRLVGTVDRKAGTCGMLVVIVLLLIAIVVVAAWPK